MYLTMAKDLRVILIWLAKRLVTMDNLGSFDKDLQYSYAYKTIHLHVPIASRLGIYRLKTQLEDLAFRYLDPYNYKKVYGLIRQFGAEKKEMFEDMKKKLQDFFKENNVNADISGRVKTAHSIYKKIKQKDFHSISQIYDIFAIRVILPDSYDKNGEELLDKLYSTIGLIHKKWKPVSGRFKDYIAVPKPNVYRSLHTVILGLSNDDNGQPVEIQVRSMSMHKEAEFGIASHWIYKEKQNSNPENLQSKIEWLQGLKEIDHLMNSEDEVMRGVDLNFFNDRIFVLTPNGDVKDLPKGAVPLDFAYMVHTDVGHKCFMAKVNSMIVPLDYELKNGDVVEIVTREDVVPKLRWLSIVQTSAAKSKIKAWFNRENSALFLKEGREAINEFLKKIGKEPLTNTYSVLKEYNGQSLSVLERERLLEEVGKGAHSPGEIIKKIFPDENFNETEEKKISVGNDKISHGKMSVVVGGEAGLPIRLPACCKPEQGDKIVAYVTRGSRLTIHKKSCYLLEDLDDDRMFIAEWGE